MQKVENICLPDEKKHKKRGKTFRFFLGSSGRRTRTSGLRVMSPTSYQLLYPAILDCKYTDIF